MQCVPRHIAKGFFLLPGLSAGALQIGGDMVYWLRKEEGAALRSVEGEQMRQVKCEECGKRYDYDVDDFCPKCGAFNQPPRAAAVYADGSIGRREGIHEGNHSGSFVHAEYHEENRRRRGTPLAGGTKRTAGVRRLTAAGRTETVRTPRKPVGIIGWIVGAIVLINLLGSLLSLLR